MLFFRSDNEVVTRPRFLDKNFLKLGKKKNDVCKNPMNPKPKLQC